jgi:hypothetical protein
MNRFVHSLPIIPENIPWANLIVSLLIVYFILFIFFRKNILNFTNKTIPKAIIAIPVKIEPTPSNDHLYILLEIKNFFDNMTLKMLEYQKKNHFSKNLNK